MLSRRRYILAFAALALGTGNAFATPTGQPALKRADRKAHNIFAPFYRMGGVLGFAVYDHADNDEADARAAIHDTLVKLGKVDDLALNSLHPRQLSEAQFFGDWYTPDGNLVWNGTITTSDGRRLERPTFRTLAGVKVASASAGGPDIGQGGQFAYAFANPPYPLTAPYDHVQRVFDGIRHALLPPGDTCIITDWTRPDLDKVSAYFAPGKEWWGVFLFTIYDTSTRRLTVIIGSATD